MSAPLIVGIGGSTRPGSSSERVLRACLAVVEAGGGRTSLIGASQLRLPPYEAGPALATRSEVELVEAVREADGVIIASPGYHGGISGLVKNALDYTEDLREDRRPYLDGRAVGCIACAAGWQAANSTLSALRAVVHALRGWPTPVGVAINTADVVWEPSGMPEDPQLQLQLQLLVSQVLGFAERMDGEAVA
jgi:FMN reductase